MSNFQFYKSSIDDAVADKKKEYNKNEADTNHENYSNFLKAQ